MALNSTNKVNKPYFAMRKQKHILITGSEHILHPIGHYHKLAKCCKLSGAITEYKPVTTQKIHTHTHACMHMYVHTHTHTEDIHIKK